MQDRDVIMRFEFQVRIARLFAAQEHFSGSFRVYIIEKVRLRDPVWAGHCASSRVIVFFWLTPCIWQNIEHERVFCPGLVFDRRLRQKPKKQDTFVWHRSCDNVVYVQRRT